MGIFSAMNIEYTKKVRGWTLDGASPRTVEGHI